MKKFIVSVFSLLLLFANGLAYAETLPPKGSYVINTDDYPLLYKYMEDYANQLFEKFNPGIFWVHNYGTMDAYYIHKDGTVSNLSDTKGSQERLLRKLVLDNPPPPFPKDLEADRITVDLALLRGYEDDIRYYYSPSRQVANITLTKERQKKKWFKKNGTIR